MSVSETIVREFFELHGFLVHQRRKYVASAARDDEEIDFLVLNPQPESDNTALPLILEAADLRRVRRAMVVVKGWHTETFSPSRLASSPEIFRFVRPGILKQAGKFFGGDEPLTRILVVPALPEDLEARTQSLDLLRSKGVDAVIPFRTLLAGLVQHTEINRNYTKSDLLQIIRVLKNYGFLRDSQLELFKPRRKRENPARAGE